ncbi:alpha/beta fold hydrolase [Ornithinibacillus caprae]|uniref:alpha/beta fold hydrolase n=1 Tax=Ornithinibacillus caprae TaxID=2678566 RepID=UPI0031B5CB80
MAETLSESNRVIMFHRPGLGLSEIGSELRNTKAVVNELNDILYQLEIHEPFILVGHSYGGLCVQHFAKEHPLKVAGVILVDSTSIDLEELDTLDLPVLDGEDSDEIWMRKCYSYSLMNKEELRGIVNPSLTEKLKLLPLDIQERFINFQINPSLYKAMYSEISNWKKNGKSLL